MRGVVQAGQQPSFVAVAVAAVLESGKACVVRAEADGWTCLNGDPKKQVAGCVDGFTVRGQQDVLVLVAVEKAGQVRRRSGEVFVPRLRAGGIRPVGVSAGGALEGSERGGPRSAGHGEFRGR
jgi:hypothetical protein